MCVCSSPIDMSSRCHRSKFWEDLESHKDEGFFLNQAFCVCVCLCVLFLLQSDLILGKVLCIPFFSGIFFSHCLSLFAFLTLKTSMFK